MLRRSVFYNYRAEMTVRPAPNAFVVLYSEAPRLLSLPLSSGISFPFLFYFLSFFHSVYNVQLSYEEEVHGARRKGNCRVIDSKFGKHAPIFRGIDFLSFATVASFDAPLKQGLGLPTRWTKRHLY